MSLSIGGFDTGVNLPTFTTEGWGVWVTILATIILVIFSISILIWLVLQYRTYNRRIVLFENISGQGYQVTIKDKARVVKVGDGGEELLFLKKLKVYRTAYGKKMGKNTYWFAVGQDGYWYNFILGDLDAKMGMLDIEPIDRDMRYMHVAIRKNIQDRYRKINFMEKYGTMIMGGVFLLIMVIAVWLLMSKAGDLIQESTAAVEAAKLVIDPVKSAMSNLDKLCSQSGITPA